MQVMLDTCADSSQAACHQSALHLSFSQVCQSVSQSVSQLSCGQTKLHCLSLSENKVESG